MAVGAFVLVVLLAVVPILLVWSARAPVRRARVERFAHRQRLQITPDNGDRVIAYLATTRRWRVAGLLAAYGAGLTWATYAAVVHGGDAGINLLQLLAGWFIGAVVAEARLARRPAGERRAASLQPRELSAYLSRFARVVATAALAVSLALAAATLLAAIAGRGPDGRLALLATLAAVAVAAIVWTVRRRVLDRAQPVLPPDQLAADDAIRSRSLHVLAGAGTTLVLYAVIWQLQALSDAFPGAAGGFHATGVLLSLGAPVLGWVVATRPWAVRRPREAEPAAAD